MNLALKLDRIAARADELRAMLSEGVSGEAYVKASKELSEIEPVVARIGELREAERAREDASVLLEDPEMRELAEAELFELKESTPALEHGSTRVAAEGRGRCALSLWRSGRRRVATRRGCSPPNSSPCTRNTRRAAAGSSKSCRYSDTGLGGLKDATAEITGRNVFARLKYESRRASRAAGAGDGEPGAHSYLDRYGGRAAGSRGSRRADR